MTTNGVNGEVHIRVAELEERERILQFYELRRKLCPLFKPLEKTPTSEVEILLFKDTVEDGEVSEAVFDECRKLFERMDRERQQQQEQNDAKLRRIRTKISELVANENREIDSPMADRGYARKLDALEAELDSLTIRKPTAVQRNIQHVRTELRHVWKTWNVPEEEAMFPEFAMNEPLLPVPAMNEATDQIYKVHLEHLQKWKAYPQKHQALFSEIKRRYQLKEQLHLLQAKNTSKDRFKNRGGLMLKLQGDFKGVNEALPKCETKLLKLAREFERENGKKLVVDGEEIIPLLSANVNKTPLTSTSSLRNMHRTTPLIPYGGSVRNLASSKRRSTSDPDLGAKCQRYSSFGAKEN